MMRSVKELRGYANRATNGVIGTVDDFYFNDEDWGIHYLVVNTGTRLSGRRVLISPDAIGSLDWMIQELPVSLTKAQVKRSPSITTRKPVSRQQQEYARHFRYPTYWGGAGFWGMGAYPGTPTTEDNIHADLRADAAQPQPWVDCHLRSSNAIIGYDVEARDGHIGHVDDLLVDDRTWAVRHVIVKTGHWWSGQRVLVAPRWIQDVNWSLSTISVDLTRMAIKGRPPYDAETQLDRQREQALHDHYGRTG